ncbi:hypothetical protein ACFYOD_06420 [Streptomyces sp. NPDC006703]|uniref:hypothetical protein n=1 Tax=Streptomyces sp. NPDC006703 TaxID=3364759 RepID=UPI0036A6BF05
MGIELERVLVRLRESEGVESASFDEGAAFEVLGALSVVDPRRVTGEGECDRPVPAG